jgi:hypothetical protein
VSTAEPQAHFFSETRQYGLSHADLARILPRFMPGTAPTVTGNTYVFSLAAGQAVSLAVGPEQERRLGLLRMPFVDLTFGYEGLDAGERAAFRARFDRSFQKGGG